MDTVRVDIDGPPSAPPPRRAEGARGSAGTKCTPETRANATHLAGSTFARVEDEYWASTDLDPQYERHVSQ